MTRYDFREIIGIFGEIFRPNNVLYFDEILQEFSLLDWCLIEMFQLHIAQEVYKLFNLEHLGIFLKIRIVKFKKDWWILINLVEFDVEWGWATPILPPATPAVYVYFFNFLNFLTVLNFFYFSVFI